MNDPRSQESTATVRTGRTLREQFLWPLGFLRVQFNGRRRWLYGVPGLFGALSGVVFWYLPGANIAHDVGLLTITSGLLQMLVGFYVAALTVVIALPVGRLDDKIAPEDNPPRYNDVELTWRGFASRITAYLVFISLLTYIIATAMVTIRPAMTWEARHVGNYIIAGDVIHSLTRVLAGAGYVALFMHVISVTLLSLFWVAAKIPEAQAESKNPWG